ncbi:putative Isochorismatase family hydrolase [Mycena rebaudengoi]|nr:putative Isochorismatase family hydrolase [Mycena rebaudengoi]
MSAPKSFRQLIGVGPSTVSASSSSSALIVIDAQQTYSSTGVLAISGIDAAQKTIASTVDKFRKGGAPVIWVQHDAGQGVPIFSPGTPSYDFIDDVRPKDDEKIVVKKAPSSFTGTDLHQTLQSLGIKQVVLEGYMSHVCITGTARSAMEHGYDVVVVKDGIGDRDIPTSDGTGVVKASDIVDMVCHELADAVGTVITSSEIKA